MAIVNFSCNIQNIIYLVENVYQIFCSELRKERAYLPSC